ncbi:MAG: Nif3-like dinuclear metal center hexameric protein [Bacteroidota bacterium]
MQIREIIQSLERLAPPAYQESYDNSGLICGSADNELTGVLVTLDCTEPVIEEAIRRGCNLVVAHHPIVFKGLKRLNGKNYVERTVINAIRAGVAIYAIHTNLDHVQQGVSKRMADKLGLTGARILQPKRGFLRKLTVFVPEENQDTLLAALHKAGAGTIGKYSNCSFTVKGTGRFLPGSDANPSLGEKGKSEAVPESRIEVILPFNTEASVLAAMRKAHPYEEVAYYLQTLENEWQDVGAGMVGNLPEPMETMAFLQKVKDTFGAGCLRHTEVLKPTVRRIALCGGSGSFLLRDAISAGADVYITADFKYHEFFDAENHVVIADIGHFESEQYTKDLLFEHLKEKFANIAVCFSETETNPVRYL